MQLTLPIHISKHNAFSTFLSADNAGFVAYVDSVLSSNTVFNNASQRICYLTGLSGSGKTHCLLATCDKASRVDLSYQYLDLTSLVKMPPEVMDGLAYHDVLCIDNLHVINDLNDEDALAWQRTIFDTINIFTERKGRLLLLSSRKSVADSNFKLLDLNTRLMWGTNYTLHMLSDQEKLEALMLHAKALGLSLQHESLRFLISRSKRDMHQLIDQLQELDKASLADKRKITIPFIKQALAL